MGARNARATLRPSETPSSSGTLTPREPDTLLNDSERPDPNLGSPVFEVMELPSYRTPSCSDGVCACCSSLMPSGTSSYRKIPAPVLFAAGVNASSPVAEYWRKIPDAPNAPVTRPNWVRPSAFNVCVRSLNDVPISPLPSTSSWPYHCAVPPSRSEVNSSGGDARSARPITSSRRPRMVTPSLSAEGSP